jgi:hypothetical protein
LCIFLCPQPDFWFGSTQSAAAPMYIILTVFH